MAEADGDRTGRDSVPRSGTSTQSMALPVRCPYLAEELCAHSAPVRELVISIPTPGCDHRQHQDPALAQQVSISAG